MLIAQAVMRFINLIFFLVNSYYGEPGKLIKSDFDPEEVVGYAENVRDIADGASEIIKNA